MSSPSPAQAGPSSSSSPSKDQIQPRSDAMDVDEGIESEAAPARGQVSEQDMSADEGDEVEGSQRAAAAAGEDDAAAPPKKARKPRQSASGAADGPDRAPGTTHLPFARVQRIIKADKEVMGVSREAHLMVSLATEHFIQQLVDQGSVRARLDKRKIVTIKDLSIVAEHDPTFAFLRDVIPSTVPLSDALAARKRRLAHLAGLPGEGNNTVIDTLPLASTVGSKNPEFPGALAKRAVKRGKKSEPGSSTAAAAAAAAEGMDT